MNGTDIIVSDFDLEELEPDTSILLDVKPSPTQRIPAGEVRRALAEAVGELP